MKETRLLINHLSEEEFNRIQLLFESIIIDANQSDIENRILETISNCDIDKKRQILSSLIFMFQNIMSSNVA